MLLPQDNFMLLSFVNTQLRDFYGSLDEMCKELEADKEEIISKLAHIDYEYDEDLNKFI